MAQAASSASKLSKLQIALLTAVLVAAIAGAVFTARRYLDDKRAAQYIAEIGDYKVTLEQLKLRQAHANVYYPGSGTPDVALAQLVQGYLAAELMKQQGVTLDRTTWLAEEQRIDQQTRDPATLAKIKFVYGSNHDDYLYVGILPDFAQSRIFKLFRSSPAMAEEARRKAAAFLDRAEAAPGAFAALAEKEGVRVQRLSVDAKKGLTPLTGGPDATEEGLRDASPKSEQEMRLRAEMQARATNADLEAAAGLLQRLESLQPGQVYRNTLESPESFEAVRLIERRAGGASVVEMASFPKPDFGRWFWREAGKIPVRIRNEGLKAQFVRDVSWAKQLNLL